jgi:hypothetical protein
MYMTDDGKLDEFNPVTEAIDPNIDAGPDPVGVIGALITQGELAPSVYITRI